MGLATSSTRDQNDRAGERAHGIAVAALEPGHVDGEASALPGTHLADQAGAGVEARATMDRYVANFRVGFQDMLNSVAVMHILRMC